MLKKGKCPHVVSASARLLPLLNTIPSSLFYKLKSKNNSFVRCIEYTRDM